MYSSYLGLDNIYNIRNCLKECGSKSNYKNKPFVLNLTELSTSNNQNILSLYYFIQYLSNTLHIFFQIF